MPSCASLHVLHTGNQEEALMSSISVVLFYNMSMPHEHPNVATSKEIFHEVVKWGRKQQQLQGYCLDISKNFGYLEKIMLHMQ